MTAVSHTPVPRKASTAKRGNEQVFVAEWPRNRRELVRISIDRIETRFVVSIRVWWRNDDGIYKPSPTGLTLFVSHLPKLVEHLEAARKKATIFGLLEPLASTDLINAHLRQRTTKR